MKQTLLSLTLSAVLALCFPLAAKAVVFTVSWGSFSGGSITVTTGVTDGTIESGTQVTAGSILYVNVSPNTGYYLTSLKANGEDIYSTRTITVNDDTTIEATFASIPSGYYIVRYPVTMLADIEVYNGNERIMSEGIVQSGSYVTVDVNPSASVNISSITANNSTIESGAGVTVTTSLTIGYTLESIDVYVNYEYNQTNGQIQIYSVVDGEPYSSLDPTSSGGEDNVLYTLQEFWVFAVPSSGYVVEYIYVNDVPQVIQEVSIYNPFLGTQTYWGAKSFAQCELSMLVNATFKVDDGTGPGPLPTSSGITMTPEVAKSYYDNMTNTLTAEEDVTVFNTSGQALLKVPAGNQASLSGMPNGIYIVKGKTTSFKIAK